MDFLKNTFSLAVKSETKSVDDNTESVYFPNKSKHASTARSGGHSSTINLKILILGACGVGKSSIICRYCRHYFSRRDKPPTVGIEVIGQQVPNFFAGGYQAKVVVHFWDVSHKEIIGDNLELILSDVHGVIMVCEPFQKDSLVAVDQWREAIAGLGKKAINSNESNDGNIPLMLLVNKSDPSHSRRFRHIRRKKEKSVPGNQHAFLARKYVNGSSRPMDFAQQSRPLSVELLESYSKAAGFSQWFYVSAKMSSNWTTAAANASSQLGKGNSQFSQKYCNVTIHAAIEYFLKHIIENNNYSFINGTIPEEPKHSFVSVIQSVFTQSLEEIDDFHQTVISKKMHTSQSKYTSNKMKTTQEVPLSDQRMCLSEIVHEFFRKISEKIETSILKLETKLRHQNIKLNQNEVLHCGVERLKCLQDECNNEAEEMINSIKNATKKELRWLETWFEARRHLREDNHIRQVEHYEKFYV